MFYSRLNTEDYLLDDHYYKIREKNRLNESNNNDSIIDKSLNRLNFNKLSEDNSMLKLKDNNNIHNNGIGNYNSIEGKIDETHQAKQSIDFSNKNILNYESNYNFNTNVNKEVIHKGYKSSSIIDNSIDNKSQIKNNNKSSLDCSQDISIEKKKKSQRNLINDLQRNTMVIDDEDFKFLIEYRKFLLEPEEENVTHHWYLKITISEICFFILNLLSICTAVSSRYMSYSKEYFDVEVDKFISDSTLYINSFLNFTSSKYYFI